MAQQAKVLILAGRGRYEDPWHDHAATSHRLARLLGGHGLGTTVRSLFRDVAPELDAYDLLIVNGGTGRIDPDFDGSDEDWLPVHHAIHDYAFAGRPILVYHQGINAFLDNPEWRAIVGGRWVRGTTYHPQQSDAVFRIVPGAHPLTEGLTDIHVNDERYTLLFPEPGTTVTTTQFEAGADQPTSWVNVNGGLRTIYDSLGHDAATLESPTRVALLMHEINWLLGRSLDV
jgi:hypothetical protein